MNEERYKKWFEEAKEQTIETLPEFMKRILDEPQSYDSIVEAITACALGAAWAADHHPNGGITGFQGSWVMWQFIKHWMCKGDSCGLKLVDYDDMLYPQYDYKFCDKTIDRSTWKALQKKAAEYLAEDRGVEEVKAHWRSIVNGVVPFGYTVKED